GAVGAIVANSLIMCFPIMAYRFARKKLGTELGLAAWIFCWISYEYIHHNWDLSWPWLTLGNGFATKPSWVQWYRYTGTTGGSLWVLLTNAVVFHAIKNYPEQKRSRAIHLGILIGLMTPVTLGWLFYPGAVGGAGTASMNGPNIVVVQPNVEAYTEKFSTAPDVLTQSLIDLSESRIDSNTRLVVWPETAIPAQMWEHEIEVNPIYQMVEAFVQRHPDILLVTGIDSYKLWGEENPGGMSIRRMQNGLYYEGFNTAMGKSASSRIQLYHKSKLVPGVEALPSWLGFMSSVFDDFGGIAGSLGRSQQVEVFASAGNPYLPAPVICYESIYSDFTTQYVRAGANVITVITNDGWWGNTAGHHQHMHYARLRAIETGLWVARSANTGISCFIDPHGHIYQAKPWDEQAAIKMDIPPVNDPTFYARTGDWLSKFAFVAAAVLLLLAFFNRILWKR
ncbi:MAG TPA: apolipoprotein N-acyltransferase, partial [Phnomibacter sp.]|nr:apolipoprotein N-acyltransferase [Phnomibacter sp.]